MPIVLYSKLCRMLSVPDMHACSDRSSNFAVVFGFERNQV